MLTGLLYNGHADCSISESPGRGCLDWIPLTKCRLGCITGTPQRWIGRLHQRVTTLRPQDVIHPFFRNRSGAVVRCLPHIPTSLHGSPRICGSDLRFERQLVDITKNENARGPFRKQRPKEVAGVTTPEFSMRSPMFGAGESTDSEE